MKLIKQTLLLGILLLYAGRSLGQLYNLTVQTGYAETTQASPGDTIHIWAQEWGANRTFSHWSGDTAFLEMPDEWHTRVIMPAQNVTIKANTKVLPTGSNNPFIFEMIQGKNIAKPVYSYFPANGTPKAVVWLWHGTGGSAKNWVWKDFEMRQFCNYLIGNNLALIITESDESTLNTDLDNDGNLRYNYTADTLNNYDVANVRAIRDTFINRGKMSWATPQAAVGFSAGGAFSVTVATFLNWKAAVSHNSQGSGYVQAARIPILLSMSLRDMHPDVGAAGNQEAYDNYQYLLDQGQCSQFFMQRPSPTYSQRFRRLPGVNATQAAAINNELIANGCFGLGSYLVKSPNQIEDMILSNPQSWPNIVALNDTIREWVKDELAVMWSSHHFHHDFMAADLKFILNQCAPTVATKEAEEEVVPGLRVLPNPAGGEIRLPENTVRARIFNLAGVTVMEHQTSPGAGTLDVSSLRKGVYFLEIWPENGPRQVGKWVKL